MVSGGLGAGLVAWEEAAKADKVPTSVSISKEESVEVVCSWAIKKEPSSSLSAGRN